MKEDESFFDLDHILKVVDAFINEVDPYWGYEEKIALVKRIYKFHNYLLPDEETIIETAKLLMNGTDNT